MSLKLEKARLASSVTLPGSKSHANRYLILAARLGQRTVRALPAGEDVTHMLKTLSAVGLQIQLRGDEAYISNSFPECENDDRPMSLDVGEGGTTARFLAAMLATGIRCYHLKLAGRLSARPWEELLVALSAAGAHAQLSGNIVTIQGPLDWSKMPTDVSAARSTQFASALQLAGCREGFQLRPAHLETSKAYWDLTLACCQQVQSNDTVTVPLDWSSASYPLAFAAVTGDETVLPGLKQDPLQADSVLGRWLKLRGALEETPTGTRVWGLHDRAPITMDMSQCLDLTPAMAFLCAHLHGESTLTGLTALVHKESDRLQAIVDQLLTCGVKVVPYADRLCITGGVGQGPWDLRAPADHRLVMTAALFLCAHGGGSLTNETAVAKSFPLFFQAMGFR